MRMLKENFEQALHRLINYATEDDSEKTCFIQGVKEVLEASQRGETITIEDK